MAAVLEATIDGIPGIGFSLMDYDPNADLSIEVLEMMMTIMSQRAPGGSTGNTWVILGDKLGHMKIDKALKAIDLVNNNKEYRPKIILSDIQMNNVNGVESLYRLITSYVSLPIRLIFVLRTCPYLPNSSLLSF